MALAYFNDKIVARYIRHFILSDKNTRNALIPSFIFGKCPII